MSGTTRITGVGTVGVPVTDQGRLVGVLQAGSRAPRRFTDDDRQFLELVAAGAGPAIARARLADALQLYRRQLEAQTGELEAANKSEIENLTTPILPLDDSKSLPKSGAMSASIIRFLRRCTSSGTTFSSKPFVPCREFTATETSWICSIEWSSRR